jgi:hypothetical protein
MHDLYAMGYLNGQQAKFEARIELLERLIEKYAAHVEKYAGVYFLEDRHRGDSFTDEEWTEIRLLAKEDN